MTFLSNLMVINVLGSMAIGFIGDDKPMEWEISLNISPEFLDESKLTLTIPKEEKFPELKNEMKMRMDNEASNSAQTYKIIMDQIREDKCKHMSGDEIYQRAFDEVTGYVKPEEK